MVEKLGDELHYICTINEANMGPQVVTIAERYKNDDGADAESRFGKKRKQSRWEQLAVSRWE